MASEYNLKLKAQLDLSDAQAQINRLNTQASGGVGGGVAPSNINFNNLNQNLNNLKISISNLNTNITKLSQRIIESTIKGGGARGDGKIITGGSNVDEEVINWGKLLRIGATTSFISSRLTALQRAMGKDEENSAFNSGIGLVKAGLAGARTGMMIAGPAGGALLGVANVGFELFIQQLQQETEYRKRRLKALEKSSQLFKELDTLEELEDVKNGNIGSIQIQKKVDLLKKNIKEIQDKQSELPEYSADLVEAYNKELAQLMKDLSKQEHILELAKRKEEALQREEKARQKELDYIQKSYGMFEHVTSFQTTIQGVSRMISNNRLDKFEEAPQNINNLLSIFDTLNEEAKTRRQNMESAKHDMLTAGNKEDYGKAYEEYTLYKNEINAIGGLMASIQGKIADFDKQFSTIEKLPGVKASEISSLAAIGGGGGGSATSGERGMYIEMQRSNQLLDTIDKTIKGLDDYIKSKDFGGGATFQ